MNLILGVFKLAGLSAFVLGVSFLLGWGLARLLVPERSRALVLAPWIGIAQTGLLLIALGWLGVPVRQALWAPVLAGAGSLAACFFHFMRDSETALRRRELSWLALGTFVAAFLFTLPALGAGGKLAGFTIGNLDLFDYALTAEVVKDKGFKPFVKPFGGQPEHADATIGERVASWQVPSTRWIPTFYLSFLSCVTGIEAATLFSILICAAYALFIPILWLLAKDAFGLEEWGWAGFAVAIVNPHLLYVAYHGFLPQIVAMGFMLCFFATLESFLFEKLTFRSAALAGLFAAGVLASYLELFVFIALAAVAYFLHLTIGREITAREMLMKLGAGGAITAILAPYQTFMLIPIILFHSDWAGGGWNMSERYYLFITQMGIYRYDPQWITPFALFEKLGGVIVIVGLALALLVAKRRALLFWIAAPFVLSGVSSYLHHWNYRYFKNITYIYFWAPMLLGWLVTYFQNLDRQLSGARRVFAVLTGLLLCVALYAGTNSVRRIKSSAVSALRVPQDNANLAALNRDPAVKTYFVDNKDPWQSLWIGYRLRDKNLVFDVYHPYLRNDVRRADQVWNESVLTQVN